jgi:hypothetical protein
MLKKYSEREIATTLEKYAGELTRLINKELPK